MKNTIKNCIIRQLGRRGENVQFTCWNVSYAVLKTNTDTHTDFMIGMCKLAVDLSAWLIFPLVGQHTVSHMCPRERRHQYNLFLSVIFTVFPWFFFFLCCTAPLLSTLHSLSLNFEDNLSSFYINHGTRNPHNLCSHYVKHNVK